MGKGLEQTLLQRRCVNGNGAHEKMLNIINHQGNVNQNHNEVPLYTHQDGYGYNNNYFKNPENKKCYFYAEDVEKLEPWYIAGRNLKWKVWQSPNKLNRITM